LYTYFGYIAVVLIIGFIRNKRVIKKNIEPIVTFMIAAYNEEKEIAKKIENSLLLDYPKEKLQIIVVSDGSTDNTDSIVDSYKNLGIRLIRVEGRVGKTEARNIAMKEIESDITIFSDGTTNYDTNAVKNLVRNFADSSVGMVSGNLKYIDNANTQMGAGQKLYWRYETLIKEAQTRLGTLTGAIGCITAFRTSLYHPLPANVIEDFTAPLMFVQKGYRVVFEKEAICHEETTKKSKNEWSMRVRVIRGGITGLIYAKSVLNPFINPVSSFQLFSHKILRWMIPMFGILLFLSSLMSVLTSEASIYLQILFGLQILFYFIAIISFILEKFEIHNRILGIPLYFIVINFASLVAIYKVLTSKLEATWETDR
jgi:cellulose synthase/poly-beta-1,6-N-acetylglucosamine synthase-like glycosyltransferase